MGDAGDGAVCMGSTLRWSRDAFLDSVGVDVALLVFWLVFLLFFLFYGWSREGWMQHTRLVIGAAIDRAAKATAAKNVDFMLMDLSDEAEKRGLMLLRVFKNLKSSSVDGQRRKREETVEVLEIAFSQEKKKPAPSPFLFYAKTTSCLQRGHERRFLASFRWHVRVLPLCSLALAMHTIAVTSEGIAMGRRKYLLR